MSTATERPVIRFSVPAVPVPQPRQRHRIATGANGKAWVHNYTPTRDPVNAFKAAVQAAFRAEYAGAPLDGPVAINVEFLMPRPKAMLWKTRPMPRAPYLGRADWDNLVKALTDALTGLCYRDDRQIYAARVVVWYAAGNEQPGAVVAVASDANAKE